MTRRYWPAVRVVLDLVTVKYMTQYLSSPMKLFGMLGLIAGSVGAIAGISTLVMWFDGFHMNRNPLLLLTVFASFVALQFFVLGMLGELGVRTYYESQGRHPYAIRDLVNFDLPLIHSGAANDEEPPVRKADKKQPRQRTNGKAGSGAALAALTRRVLTKNRRLRALMWVRTW